MQQEVVRREDCPMGKARRIKAWLRYHRIGVLHTHPLICINWCCNQSKVINYRNRHRLVYTPISLCAAITNFHTWSNIHALPMPSRQIAVTHTVTWRMASDYIQLRKSKQFLARISPKLNYPSSSISVNTVVPVNVHVHMHAKVYRFTCTVTVMVKEPH